MDLDIHAASAEADPAADPPPPDAWPRAGLDAGAAVTALYAEHALGLVRLAHIMLGTRAAAEDVVQEAFCGLYRRWPHLRDKAKALGYVRSSVLNGCRSVRRHRVTVELDPVRKTITVRKLPFAALPLRESASTIALSPDGTELAVAVQIASGRELRLIELRVYMLATGAVQVWTTSPGYSTFIQDLSWGTTGVLGIDLMNTGHTDAAQAGIRLLSPNVAAGSLLAASTLAVPQTQPAGFQVGGSFTIIDDGAAVVTVVGRTASPGRKVVSQFEVLSTRTGRVIRAFLPSTRPDGEESEQGLVWANSAGTVLAGFVPYTGTHPGSIGPLEWISGSQYAPIRGLPRHAPFHIAI